MEHRQNPAVRPVRKKTGKGQRNGLSETKQIAHGKIQELRQDAANLEAHLEVIRKQIDALNALIRHLEAADQPGKTET